MSKNARNSGNNSSRSGSQKVSEGVSNLGLILALERSKEKKEPFQFSGDNPVEYIVQRKLAMAAFWKNGILDLI